MGRGAGNLLAVIFLLQVPVAALIFLFSFYITDGSPPGPQNYVMAIVGGSGAVLMLLGASLMMAAHDSGGRFRGILLCCTPYLLWFVLSSQREQVCELFDGCASHYRQQKMPCGINRGPKNFNLPCIKNYVEAPSNPEDCRHYFHALGPAHRDLARTCFESLQPAPREAFCGSERAKGASELVSLACPY